MASSTRIGRLSLETYTPNLDKATPNPEEWVREFSLRYHKDYRDIISALREHVTDTGILLPVILTANLPAAAASMNGRILIEDTGAVGNLIIYARAARYRFVGVAF